MPDKSDKLPRQMTIAEGAIREASRGLAESIVAWQRAKSWARLGR